MDKENYRFYIKVRAALGISPTIIHDELTTVFGDEAPSYATVARWAQWSREGREEVEDEARPGRPVTETTDENIEQIRDAIDDDPYVTIRELQGNTNLSYGTIQRIISDHLKLKKLTARYVPKHLTASQRAERVRICKENLTKFEQGTWRLCDVVAGDESWSYHKQIGRKASNAAWVTMGDPSPTIVQRSRFAPRTLLCIFV
ncbi:unnamed protein product [Rotaria sordida]|uniref:Transposase n=1 Tax=Rotaria sordida TaxID=392033 RepID=A0A819NKP5_9BILA|nr:unnamed protein product [Rotaria sordida]CAF3998455.1 unnamed protein product [Rotaria sordida]